MLPLLGVPPGSAAGGAAVPLNRQQGQARAWRRLRACPTHRPPRLRCPCSKAHARDPRWKSVRFGAGGFGVLVQGPDLPSLTRHLL